MTFLTLEMDPNVNKPLHIHSTEGWMFCEIAGWGGGGKSLVVQFFYFGNVNEIKRKILKKNIIVAVLNLLRNQLLFYWYTN